MRIGISALHIRLEAPGSPLIYLTNMVKHIARLDRQNQYVLFATPGNKSIWQVDPRNFTVVTVPQYRHSNCLRVLYENLFLPVAAKFYRIDVLFFPLNVRPLLTACRSVVAVHLVPNSTWVRSVGLAKRVHYRLLGRASNRRAHRLIAVSETAKQEIVDFFAVSPARVDVVYHGVPPEFNASRPGNVRQVLSGKYGITKDYIVSVISVNVEHKNLKRLLEAFLYLKCERGIPHQLVLIGGVTDSDLRRFEQAPLRAEDRSEIILTGYLRHEELPPLYANASVFIDISYQESFGIPVIEAMACGAPVVVSDVTAMPEIAGGAAVTVDPLDSRKVADALYEVLSNQPLRNELSRKALARAKEFTWERAALQTIEVFGKAMQER